MHLRTLAHWLLSAAIFSLPFGIRTLLIDSSAYATGNFSEMAAVFLSLSDLLLFGAIFLFLLTDTKKLTPSPRIILVILGLLALLFAPIFWAIDPLLHLGKWLHIVLWTLGGIFIAFRADRETMATALLVSALFQGTIALFQFFLQHSIDLSWIGEQNISPETLGAAKFFVQNELFLRPYGTLVHPNILACFLGISFFFGKESRFSKLRWFLLFPILLTFSRAGITATILGIFMETTQYRNWKAGKQMKNIILIGALLLACGALFSEQILARINVSATITERIGFAQHGIDIALLHPLGVGLGQATLALLEIASAPLKPWEYQPPHLVWILAADEVGIITSALLLTSFLWLIRKKWQTDAGILITLFIFSLTDHFLWDIQTGISLALLSLSFLFTEKRNDKTSISS